MRSNFLRLYGQTAIWPFFTVDALGLPPHFTGFFLRNDLKRISLIPQGTVSFYDSTHLNFTIMIYLRTYTDKMTH